MLAGAALALSGAACGMVGVTNLNFRTDARLHFLSPPARTMVQNPITVRWSISGFKVEAPGSAPPSPDAGYFAVFVDRAPIRPGDTMRSVASRDEQCLHRPGCPDEAYLEQRSIYTTTRQTLTLGQVPNLAGDNEKVQLHTVTVVLMDTSGHRIGESAWQLDLRMRRVGL
jgi:hypothetical protein